MSINSLFRIVLLTLSIYFPLTVFAATTTDAYEPDMTLPVSVISPTHPNPQIYYSNSMPVLRFTTGSGIPVRYSYVLNKTPTALPDDTPEPIGQDYISYPLHSGSYFFHIKATKDESSWGEVAHYPLLVDVDPPEIPSVSIQNDRLFIESKDKHSGVSSYQIRIIARNDLSVPVIEQETRENWIDLPRLADGDYDLLLRVKDRAGNARDVLTLITISDGIFGRSVNFSTTGIVQASQLFVAICIFAFASFIHFFTKRHHDNVHHRYIHREMSPRTVEHLAHVSKVRKRRMHVFVPLITLGLAFTFSPGKLNAAPIPSVPVITIMPLENYTEKSFYVGGISEYREGQVVLSIEQIDTNDRSAVSVPVREDGSWFYRADEYLNPGKYRLAAQYVNGALSSPMTEVYEFTVKGRLFIDQELRIIYMIFNVLISVSLVALLLRTLHLRRKIIEKTRRLKDEIKKEEHEALASLHRLKVDLETELQHIRHLKLTRAFKKEEIGREKQLGEDIREIEQIISHQSISNNKDTDL